MTRCSQRRFTAPYRSQLIPFRVSNTLRRGLVHTPTRRYVLGVLVISPIVSRGFTCKSTVMVFATPATCGTLPVQLLPAA
jgi:hypothetical protein